MATPRDAVSPTPAAPGATPVPAAVTALPVRVAGAAAAPTAVRGRPWSPRTISLIKIVMFLSCLLPLARLLVLGFFEVDGGLGANPVEFVTRSLGTWTLVALCLTLTVTPLRRLTGRNELIRFRRMIGLFAFFYASLHFLTYVWLDQYFDVPAMIHDIVKRPFITAGFAAFLLMVPLAVTSTNKMIRRLGRNWQRLHRLIYVVAVAAILHYVWHKAGKNLYGQPAIYGAIVAVLLGWRVWFAYRGKRLSNANRSATVSRSRIT